MSKFGTKQNLFWYFLARIRICQIAKFQEKIKMPKFGTKNTLFRYF